MSDQTEAHAHSFCIPNDETGRALVLAALGHDDCVPEHEARSVASVLMQRADDAEAERDRYRELVERITRCSPPPCEDDVWCYFCGSTLPDHEELCLWVNARAALDG